MVGASTFDSSECNRLTKKSKFARHCADDALSDQSDNSNSDDSKYWDVNDTDDEIETFRTTCRVKSMKQQSNKHRDIEVTSTRNIFCTSTFLK